MTMQKRHQGLYEVNGTHVYVRSYHEPEGGPVVCVIEEGPNSRVPLEKNRAAVTKRLAQSLGYKPDQIRWYEQDSQGQLLEYRAHPVDRGMKPPNDYYVGKPRRMTDAAVRSLEWNVGEKIETHAQQLRREFREQQSALRATPRLER